MKEKYCFEFDFSRDNVYLKQRIVSYINGNDKHNNYHLTKSDLGLFLKELDEFKKPGRYNFLIGTKSETVTRQIRQDFVKKYGLNPTEIFTKNP